MAYIKVGVMAIRAPDGSFLPATPIYKEVPDSRITKSGTTAQEDATIDDISKILAQKYREYKAGYKKFNKTGE